MLPLTFALTLPLVWVFTSPVIATEPVADTTVKGISVTLTSMLLGIPEEELLLRGLAKALQ